tara:strand:+ start:1594 stop:2571 length:978 start_codon:yes stop_codon:yes gene_type:complete
MENKPAGVTTKLNLDGSLNSKYVDLLDEDKPIAGQKFACVSFLSPEKIIKDKNSFYFNEFLKQWEMSKSLEKYTQFLSFLAYKYDALEFDDLTKDLEDFVKDQKDKLFTSNLDDEYKTYIDNNEEDLGKAFDEKHSFNTSVRGLKIRGCFPSQQEAELRCKMLREIDPNHDVYVGPVGMWIPFHPEAYKTGRVEYLEDELNQLMNEKDKNEKSAKEDFDKRVKESKQKAIDDNKEKALESGNVLTQTIDNDGNLVSINNVNSIENKFNNETTVSDIRKELFEDDNVVTDKNTDHGLSELTINKEKSETNAATETDEKNNTIDISK